jgi:endonuclease III
VPHPIHDLVQMLGGHPLAEFGLDPECDDDVDRWFVAACLFSGRVEGARALDAYRRLARAGLGDSAAIAHAGPEPVAAALAAAHYSRAELAAVRLARACTALVERWGAAGAGARLVDGADDLNDAGQRLVGLAPGIGPATALTFLRPLRDRFVAAREVPLSENARAAAAHLGLIGESEDAAGEPGALRTALADLEDPPTLADAEAALDALGRRACRRARSARCPLDDRCPLRAGDVAHARRSR